MTWNYRAVKIDGWYGIHEVHYNEDGSPRAYTEHAVRVTGEDLDEIRATLDRMRIAVAIPVLTPEDFKDKGRVTATEYHVGEIVRTGYAGQRWWWVWKPKRGVVSSDFVRIENDKERAK